MSKNKKKLPDCNFYMRVSKINPDDIFEIMEEMVDVIERYGGRSQGIIVSEDTETTANNKGLDK